MKIGWHSDLHGRMNLNLSNWVLHSLHYYKQEHLKHYHVHLEHSVRELIGKIKAAISWVSSIKLFKILVLSQKKKYISRMARRVAFIVFDHRKKITLDIALVVSQLRSYFMFWKGIFILHNKHLIKKNPACGRQRISPPMRIVGPIQFWRGCVIFIWY